MVEVKLWRDIIKGLKCYQNKVLSRVMAEKNINVTRANV